MTSSKVLFFITIAFFANSLRAQDSYKARLKSDSIANTRSAINDRFYWGLVFTQGWSSIEELPHGFYKPSVGGGVRFDYYFLKNLGIGVGFNYQQRGTGIRFNDVIRDLEDRDSTYIRRLRFNSLELPIEITYRTGTLFGGRGAKLFVSGEFNPQYNIESNDVYLNTADGLHVVEKVSDKYYKNDLILGLHLGVQVGVGRSSMFFVDLYGQHGTQNVYVDSHLRATNRLYGVRIAFLF